MFVERRKEARKTRDKRLYGIWQGMKQRCNNPNHTAAIWYHDKGIRVCEEWLDFNVFQEWALVNGYSEKLTIDRIDSDGNYEPSNCQWITRSENASKSHIVKRENRNKSHSNGKFMVVRVRSGIIFNNPIVRVVKTGLTKHDAISLEKLLSKEKNSDFDYYCRVADKNKEGDFVHWSDLRQYASKKKIAI